MAREGWYEDPSDPAGLRWWDGQAWTSHTVPNPVISPEPSGLAGAGTPAAGTTEDGPTPPTSDADAQQASTASPSAEAPATPRHTPARDAPPVREPNRPPTRQDPPRARQDAAAPRQDAASAWEQPSGAVWEQPSAATGGSASAGAGGAHWWQTADGAPPGPGATRGSGATGARVGAIVAAVVVVVVVLAVIGSVGTLVSTSEDVFEDVVQDAPVDGPVIADDAPMRSSDVRPGVIGPRETFSVPLVLEPEEVTGPLVIQVRGDGGLDAIVTLYDGGTEVARNDDRGADGVQRFGGDSLDPLLELELDPGTYRLEVTGFGSSSGSFTIQVETLGPGG